MATVKTVLVKGRRTQNGRFPLVVQVLHKERKKLFIQASALRKACLTRPWDASLTMEKATRKLIREELIVNVRGSQEHC